MAEFDKKALYSISYGVYVVTSYYEGRLNGQIANAVIQVTAEPPKVAIALNKSNLTHSFIEKSRVFAVSVLDAATTLEFIGLFGFKSGREVDKLSQVKYKIGVTGAPVVLENAISYIEAKVEKEMDVGTHTIFVGEVVGGGVLKEGEALTYAEYHRRKGRAPKAAPTYRPEEQKAKKMGRYVCGICGWIYDPEVGDPQGNIPPGVPFEKLPDDWTCPVCNASKDQFSPEK
ncbi:MAG: flavin reductase [Planctomycetota bacterium]|nr:flavin reductase [Planctomycetota bacterium]